MPNNKRGGGAGRPSGIFTSAHRAELLRQDPAKPTGHIAEVSGISFNLLPLRADPAEFVMELIGKFGALQGRNNVGEAEIAALIGDDGPRIYALCRDTLHDAAAHADGDSFEKSVFDEWFGRQPFIALVKELFPAIMAANGVAAMGNDLPSSALAEASKTARLSSLGT